MKNEFIVQDTEIVLMKIINNKYDSPGANTEGIQEIVTYLTSHQDDTVFHMDYEVDYILIRVLCQPRMCT